jgi:16S rRNA (uracil1498-N3)-methyltransferase
MKQSLRFTLPNIGGPIDFARVIDDTTAVSKFIAHVDESNTHHLKNIAPPDSVYLVLIGPEGDFSSYELQLAAARKFLKVSLGSHRLRTETAGLAACHILNLVNTP